MGVFCGCFGVVFVGGFCGGFLVWFLSFLSTVVLGFAERVLLFVFPIG
jgi:hypothetical protein